MASTPLSLILLTLINLQLLLLLSPQTQAQTPSAPAPSPSGPINVTGILDKNGQYTTLIRLLNETQVGNQIVSQLNSSTEGMSLFAPTDNAFNNLASGALNGLNDQQKVQLVQYHVTPKYYSVSDLLTVSNPVRTQASGATGVWGLNFTGKGNQVNVSTGLVVTQINNLLRQQFPFAVYQVDQVLLPEELFGAKPPASAPAPAKTPSGSPNTKTNSTAGGALAPTGAGGRNLVGWGLALVLGLACMAALS
ncbi:fasciclin-like arabinogalactan protein 13 [Corylus avellana]|uniref:fasciclin-like arabinogalactan protein 13 n=1 Tax=Corylus avellana TaxID=13451 RepID=UPI001E205041|nr:fasciclin-like arabinogalactan protein 13 [Corylus avellana]